MLTLVLWPAITIERLITGDFISGAPTAIPPRDSGEGGLAVARWEGHVPQRRSSCDDDSHAPPPPRGACHRAGHFGPDPLAWSPSPVFTGEGANLSPRPGHALRPHQAIELLGRDIAEPHRFLAQRRAVLVRGLGDLGGLVVADLSA